MYSLRNSTNTRTAARRRLFLTPLEDRTTPAATLSFSDGALSIIGSGQADTLQVGANGNGTLIVTDSGAGDQTLTVTQPFPGAAGDGSNEVTIDLNEVDIVSVTADGGCGDDEITLGTWDIGTGGLTGTAEVLTVSGQVRPKAGPFP